jgi:hypothetical protein
MMPRTYLGEKFGIPPALTLPTRTTFPCFIISRIASSSICTKRIQDVLERDGIKVFYRYFIWPQNPAASIGMMPSLRGFVSI